ncbi:MAG: DUF547 domain-containing protein [Flavobacteriaceae bacterium]
MLLHTIAPGDHDEETCDHARKLQAQTVLHEQWDVLLQKHVTASGNVNYSGFKEDDAQLLEYLSALAHGAPGENAAKEEKLVYYINLYNAATVKLILDNYPVRSIKDIKNPWDKKWIKVGDKLTSLGAIEHKILRKLDEPRIHFAINCASYSCPKLQNRAFSLEKLETQLNKASIEFVNDRSKNQIGETAAEISQIFKWYKSDFTTNGSLVGFINQYSHVPITAGVKVRYINYDWRLNEAK